MSPQTPPSEWFHGNPSDRPDPVPIALASGLINENDAELIKTYVYERISSSNMSKIAALQVSRLLCNCRRWSSPYSGATIVDLYKIVDGVKGGESKKGKPFSDSTQREYITRQKAFFLWLSDSGVVNIPEKKIQSVKTPPVFDGIKNVKDLLTSDEVLEIINACKNSRDRAIFSVLYEGGFRVGEIGTMTWGSVKFDAAGAVVNTLYKTSKPRYIRLIMSKNLLSTWKADYPGIPEDSALVFVNNRGNPLQYHAVRKILERTLEKTTIEKKVNPHLFRHSRITHLIQEGVSESVIKMMMWGSVNARSFAIYTHLTGMDVDRELCRVYGIDSSITNKKEKTLVPTICSRCQEICGPTIRYCPSCGQSLRSDTITEDDQLQSWLMQNRSYLAAYLNKMDSIQDSGAPE